MNRIVLGALAALSLASAGVFWWQGRAATERGAPPPVLAAAAGLADPEALPSANAAGLRGPAPPEVDEATKEQRRFDRLDHDRDGRVTRNEMLAPRVDAFRKLDADHNNLLTFEEWAVRTSNRFKAADANGDGSLNRPEFVTTKPKRAAQPQCRCAPARSQPHAAPAGRGRASAPPPPAAMAEPDVSAEEGEDPAL